MVNKRSLSITLCSLVLVFGAAGLATAQKSSVDGEWDAAMNTPGGVVNFKLIFKSDGEKLSGTVKRSSGDLPLTGRIKGNEIDFAYTINYNGHDLVLTLTGKVTGDAINGQVDFGGNGQDEWSAKRTTPLKH